MEKLVCDVCQRKFKTQDSLNQHKNDAHQQKQEESVRIEKKKVSGGQLIAVLIPVAVIGLIAYAIFWAVTADSIGSLGSTHIHADFAIFMDGQQLTPLPQQLFVLSPYVHVETGPGQGSVMHMHATDVPLRMFFDSVGMKFTPECFEVGGNKYCNNEADTLKMFVKHANSTWEQSFEYEKYAPQDLDKILVTYGHETNEEIEVQQANVTDFSKDNSGRSMILGR